jgi:hypothetical protein
VLERAGEWWDALELWIVQLWYPVQIAAVIVVVLPGCWLAARLIDHVVDIVAHLISTRPGRHPEPPSRGREVSR